MIVVVVVWKCHFRLLANKYTLCMCEIRRKSKRENKNISEKNFALVFLQKYF